METKIKPSFNFDDFYSSVKQYLNNGIPNVHLSKGCIGELCVFQEDEGRCSAIINLWQLDFNDFLGLRNEFKRLGASNVFIAETMDYESNFICNGICSEGDTRTITVEFTIEKVCDEVKSARSKAYKNMWKLVHGKARRNEKLSQFKTCELVDGVYGLIRVTENMGLSHADYNNIVRMMDLAVELVWPSKKAPSASDLRREKLSNIKICTAIARSADEYKSIWAKLNDDFYLGGAHVQKFGFLTLRQIWKAYYRASRLSLKGRCHQHDLKIVERILRQKYDSIFPNEAIHISNCVLDIHFPKSSRTHCRKFMNKVDSSIALFDEDLPF